MVKLPANVLVALFLTIATMADGKCAIVSGEAMEGRVIDEATGSPIPGALVIAQWSGDVGGPVQSSEVCFHLEVATTDAQGRYRIPAWRRAPVADWEGGFFGLRDIEVSRRTYKAGYEHVQYEPRDQRNILMRPFVGDAQDRIRFLALQGTVGCGASDGSLIREQVLWHAICDEQRNQLAARQPVLRFQNRTFLELIDAQINGIARQLKEHDGARVLENVDSCRPLVN